jgi:hypothetical protein
VAGSSPTLKAGQTDTITFTFSEAVTGFDNADVSVTGGTLSTITQVNGTTYTAVFTPTTNFQGTGSVQVLASGTGTSSWTDTLGNPGTASNTFSITEDTRSLTIAFGQTLTLSGDTLTVPTIELDGTILIQSNNPSTIITSAITGTGLIEIKNNSTLEIDGSVGSGLKVQFDVGQGVPPVLVLDDPSDFHATITGFQGKDQIHLIGMTPAQAAVWAASITFENFTGTLKFTSDGSGGTIVSDPPASTTTTDASTTTTDATIAADASTTTADATAIPVAKTLTATKTTSSRTNATSAMAAADEAIMVALSTAVAVAVALDTAVADPDGGKMSSLTISGDGTAVDVTDAVSGLDSSTVNSGAALGFSPISHTTAETLADNGTVEPINGKQAGAVSEMVASKIDAGAALQLDGSDAVNGLVITGGTNADAINLPRDHTTKTAWHVSDDGRGGKTAHNAPAAETSEDTSVQSTSADNHFSVSSPFTEALSGNGDHSVSLFKPTVEHHATVVSSSGLYGALHIPTALFTADLPTQGGGPALTAFLGNNSQVLDPGINLDSIPKDHLPQHPTDNVPHVPAQPDDNGSPAETDGAHLPRGQVDKSKVPHDPPTLTALSSDVSGDDPAHPFKTNLDHHASADSDISDVAKNHTPQHAADDSLHTSAQPDDNGSPAETDGAHLPRGQVDKSESASAKFADDGSAPPGKVPHDPPTLTALWSDVSGDDSAHSFSADPDISDVAKNHPPQHAADDSLHTPAQHDDGSPVVTDGAHTAPQVDAKQLDSFKFADAGSAHPDTGPNGAHTADPQVDGKQLDNFKFADASSAYSDTGPNGDHTADPQVDRNQLKLADDGSGHPGTGPDGAHTADPQVDGNRSDSFKFANNDGAHAGTIPNDPPTPMAPSSDSSGTHGPAAPALTTPFDVPGTVMSAAPDQFIFADKAGHGPIADHKSDVTEIDHTVPADIQHLLDTAHGANAANALDANHAIAPQDTTKVQLLHQGDFHV